MNAHKFVAELGIDKAKRVLSGAPKWATFFDGYIYSDMPFHSHCVSLEELKQVVESVEIVEAIGGLENAKQFVDAQYYTIEQMLMMKRSGLRTHHVEKAITDYELVESFKSEVINETH